MRRSDSTRAMTLMPAGARRRRCSSCAAEWRALAMRISFVGSDCAGVEPPPTSEAPSMMSSSI